MDMQCLFMNKNRLIKRCRFRTALVLVVTLYSMQMACSSVPPVRDQPVQPDTPLTIVNSTTLKVMTLNLAHGRKDGVNQFFKSEAAIRQNLEEIAAFLDRRGADVVALQEADAPSFWSGSFDHVALLSEQAGYPVFESSNHANSWFFSYGTALLSRVTLSDVVQIHPGTNCVANGCRRSGTG